MLRSGTSAPNGGLSVASNGRRSWREVKTTLRGEVKARVAPPLAELIARVAELQDSTAAISGSLAVLRREIAELTDIVKVQAEVGNETTELLGRLLATTSERLEIVEDALHQLSGGDPKAPPRSNGSIEARPGGRSAKASSSPEDVS